MLLVMDEKGKRHEEAIVEHGSGIVRMKREHVNRQLRLVLLYPVLGVLCNSSDCYRFKLMARLISTRLSGVSQSDGCRAVLCEKSVSSLSDVPVGGGRKL